MKDTYYINDLIKKHYRICLVKTNHIKDSKFIDFDFHNFTQCLYDTYESAKKDAEKLMSVNNLCYFVIEIDLSNETKRNSIINK